MSGSPFSQAGPDLAARGFSPIPLMPNSKVPGTFVGNDWRPAKGWNQFCLEQPSQWQVSQWAKWPDAGVGMACGYGGLIAIDVDHPDLIEPIRAILPPILVAKVGRKGFTAFYRGDHPRNDADDEKWWTKKNYGLKFPDPDNPAKQKRVGLLDFLAARSQTVVPPSSHPSGDMYRWITEQTLLNTPITDLPAFTQAHREAMEEVLRAHGWDAPEPNVARPAAVARRPARSPSADMLWHDDVNAVALANLSAWADALPLSKGRWYGVSYRAVAPWRTSGSGRAEAQRSANLSFHPDGIVDWGSGEKWTPIRVVAKAQGIPNPAAAAWLRQRLGMPDESTILANAAKSGLLKETYPDRSLPLDEAATELRGVLDEFETEMKAWRIYRNQSKIERPLVPRKPPVWGVRIDTSGGKTHAASEKVVGWAKCGWKLFYVVPTIKLGEQVARSLLNQGVKAQVYRGREQDDPAAPGKTMCQNLPAVAVATALGLSVRPAVCERRIDGKLVRCPSANVCGYERQSEATPDVWIVTAATLRYERPDFMSEPDGLVIDEAFHDGAIEEPVEIDTAELWRAKIEFCSAEEEDFLLDMRMKLRAVAEDNGNGPLPRAVLSRHQISWQDADQASTLEQRRVSEKILQPGMREARLKSAFDKHETRNRLARAVGALWDEIGTVLAFDQSQSGRIVVKGSAFTVTPLRPFDPSWLAPMLVLDATLTASEIIDAAVFGDEVVGWPSSVTKKADISIQWPDHVLVRQVMDAPFSMGALGLGERAKPKPRNERDIARYIRKQAALIAPERLGVISYLGLEERLAGQMPENVRWMHFGATSGLNDFETVAGLIVIGRWWLAPDKVEAKASVFAGRPVEPIGDYYRRRTGGIRMTDGSVFPATVEYHPDPVAEAVRRGITEDELSQAIGRLRAPRRGTPCFLDILGDVVLPITVDEIVEWDDIKPGAEADMLAEGVVLSNSRDAMAAFGLSKRDAEEAEVAPTSLIRTPIKEVGATSPVRAFTYQKHGPGQKANTGLALPGVIAEPASRPAELEAALRAYLEPKLGPLSSLELERLRVRESAAAQAMLARIGREATARIARMGEALKIAEDIAAMDAGEDVNETE